MAEYEFKKAVDSAMALASFGNTYFQSHEPWSLIKKIGQPADMCFTTASTWQKPYALYLNP